MGTNMQPILLGELLERQGPEVLRAAIAPGGRTFVGAVRRCGRCDQHPRCRAWLDSGARHGYQDFCPNAGFVERVTRLAF